MASELCVDRICARTHIRIGSHRTPAEPFQRADVPLKERLLALGHERHHERGAGETRSHLEQAHLDHKKAETQEIRGISGGG